MALCTSSRPDASIVRSHSVSRPIERFARFADPIRTHLVVDDDHFGMHIDARAVLQARDEWKEHAKTVVDVGRAQLLDEAAAQRLHRELFEPTMTQLAQYDDHFRTILFTQARRERFADFVGGEVLVLDIDRLAGGRDHVEIQRLHFAHAVRSVRSGFGPRDRDPHVSQRSQRATQASAKTKAVRRAARNKRRRFAGGSIACPSPCASAHAPDRRARGLHRLQPPSSDRETADRASLDDALCVLGRVITGVPAPAGQIDAAAEGDAIVDHDDLLVMRAADRMRIVVAEVHAMMRLPAQARRAAPTHGPARKPSGSPR